MILEAIGFFRGRTAAAFCVRAVVLLIVLGLVSMTEAFDDLVTNPLVYLNARLTRWLLGIIGTAAWQSGRFVHSARFSIEIIPECTGVFVAMILLALILSYPARLRFRAAGFILGMVLIFILNQIRLVTLFLLGERAPQLFEEVHVFVWQSIFILVVAFYWYAWARRAIHGSGAAEAQPQGPR